MLDEIIIDADICMKLGCSEKYQFLVEILPLVAKKAYIHTHALSEIISPKSAKDQLQELIRKNVVIVINEEGLSNEEKFIYNMTFNMLASVMIDPNRPNKNRGETCSLAYAKTKCIPVFATDESNLQPIIDRLLNVGDDNNIRCLRIRNIVEMMRDGIIPVQRKIAKAIWRISFGTNNANKIFDDEIWPIEK